MDYLAFRNLVGVSHTEAEAKALAEEVRSFRRLGIRNQVATELVMFMNWFQPPAKHSSAVEGEPPPHQWPHMGLGRARYRPDRRLLYQL